MESDQPKKNLAEAYSGPRTAAAPTMTMIMPQSAAYSEILFIVPDNLTSPNPTVPN